MKKPLTSWKNTLAALGRQINWNAFYSAKRRDSGALTLEDQSGYMFHVESLEARQMLSTVTGSGVEPQLVVTTTVDVVDADDGVTSLREAITFANSDADASTITFAGGAGEAFEGDSLIRLTEGNLVISEAITIDGSTAGGELVITGDANGDDALVAGTNVTDLASSTNDLLDDNSRVFNVTRVVDSSFTGLTITGGRTTANSGGFLFGSDQSGAGILSDGSVTVTDSLISGNSTLGSNAEGAGLSAGGNVTLNNVVVSDNSTAGSASEGGGVFTSSNATLIDTTISGNSTGGSGAEGGGIFASGDVTSTNSDITNNTSVDDGGGIFAGGIVNATGGSVSNNATIGTSFASGGGISAEEISLTDSTVNGNSTIGSSSDGGGLNALDDVTLVNTTVSGNSTSNSSSDGGGINSGGIVSLTDSTVSDNSTIETSSEGGGIYASSGVSLTNSTISGNSSESRGGGVFTFGSFTATNGIISNNTADRQGGGVFADGVSNLTDSTVSDNSTSSDSSEGGGLYVDTDLTLTNTTVTGNSTAGGLSDGGGIYADGIVTLINSTVSGNSTTGSSSEGGGIRADSFDITDSTVSDNFTSGNYSEGGGISGGNATLTNSVVSGNSTAGNSAEGGGIDGGYITLIDSTVSNNFTTGESANGGGIFSSFGDVTLENSVVDGNSTSGDFADGGGIRARDLFLNDSTVSGNSTDGEESEGGGIFTGFGDANLTNSTVSGNSTAGTYSYGGGIFAYYGSAILTNSTISGNSTAGAYSSGGGVNAEVVTLVHSTVTGNATLGDGAEGGGVFAGSPYSYYSYYGYDTALLTNSIIVGNVSLDSDSDDLFSDSTVGTGVSIIGSGSDTDASDGIINANAASIFETVEANAADASVLNGVLADNGGPVQTVALLASGGNVALDVGDAPADLLTDAIGNARDFDVANLDNGGVADAGAFELQTGPSPTPVIVSNGGGNTAAIEVAEGTSLVTDVDAADDADSEGSGLTFAISGGADATAFTIDSATGVLNFVATPDFEVPASAAGSNLYDVEVTVTDATGLTDTQTIAVTVTDLDTALTLDADASISEAGGTTEVTLTRNGDTDGSLTVAIDVSDATAVSAPTSLTFADGESSATFTVAAIDDGVLAGDRLVSIDATAAGVTGASAEVLVADEFDTIGVTLDAATGILNLTGTEEDDTIAVSAFSNGVVFLNGEITSIDGDLIQQINVAGLEGEDVIDLSDVRIDVGITISGDGGNDILTGSRFNDIIEGGSGDDIIDGGAGNDSLFAGLQTGTVDNTGEFVLTLDSIVIEGGNTAPDGSVFFSSNFFGEQATDSGIAFTTTSFDNFGAGSTELILNDGSGNTVVVSEGVTTAEGLTFSSLGTPTANNLGQIVFAGTLASDLGGFGTDGLFLFDGEEILNIATVGDAIFPGAPNPEGEAATFDRLGTRIINDAGQVLFLDSSLEGGASSGSDSGLFISDGTATGSRTIAREGSLTPDGFNEFRSFFSSASFDLNDSGSVVFVGNFGPPTGSIFSSGDQAVFKEGPDGLSFFANLGDAVTTPSGDTVNIDFISSLVSVNNNDQVLFGAGVDGFNDSLIFGDDSGVLTAIVTEGDTLADGSQIDSIEFDNVTPVTDSGYFVFESTLSNTPNGSRDDFGLFLGNVNTGEITTIFREGDVTPSGNGSFSDNLGSVDSFDFDDFFTPRDDFSVNDSGQVFFAASGLTNTAGGNSDNAGIFLFDNEAGLVEVIRDGDSFLGSTFLFDDSDGSNVSSGSIADDGTFVFEFTLSDGSNGLASGSVATPSGDTLIGGIGDDELFGSVGNDVLDGGQGNDEIFGFAGEDLIEGDTGNDIIDGDQGDDIINGGSGDDTIRGGIGVDTLSGDSGADIINGEGGDDILLGGLGIDTINGGTGNDNIDGGNQSDTIVGGDGDDEIIAGAGNDVISGSAGNDTIIGGAGNDTIIGGVGDDILSGGTGSDTIDGNSGNDIISGGTAADTITGGLGDDIINAAGGNDFIDGGSGIDTINGSFGTDIILGGEGNDTIIGGGGSDTIEGGEGDDDIVGGIGLDNILGQGGNDTITGGQGNDTIDGGAGNDNIDGGGSSDNLSGGDGNDTIVGDTGNDTISGGLGDDILSGDGANDTISGGAGNDTIDGGIGSDTLNGDEGDDELLGGNGNDTLDGGLGFDELIGAIGSDTFVALNDEDESDFDPSQDLLA